MARTIFYINFFHLTSLMSSHYLVKDKSANFLHNTNKSLSWVLSFNRTCTVLINGRTEIPFIEPGVKVNGAYYRDNLLAKKLLPDTYRKSLSWVLSFNRTCTGSSSARHRPFT